MVLWKMKIKWKSRLYNSTFYINQISFILFSEFRQTNLFELCDFIILNVDRSSFISLLLSNPHYILHFTSNTFREKKTKKTLISAEPVAFYLISLVFFFLFYKICEEKVAEAEQENHISNVNNDILVCFYIDYISDIWVFLLLQFLILWQTKAICIVLMHSPSKQLLCLSFVCYLSISSRAMPMHSVRIIIKTLIKWRNTNMIKTMTIGEMKNTHAKKTPSIIQWSKIIYD